MRAGVPRRTTSRARRWMETVHIDLVGPYELSYGGSVYLIMFVDSASRWTRPYCMASKAETTKCVQKFLFDMNHMDKDGEFTGRSYVDFCDSTEIRRGYTAPDTAQQNVTVETAN